MSSPLSSLKKGKRSPLNSRQPRVPFRQSDDAFSANLMDIPSDFLQRDVLSRLPKSSHTAPSTAPTDHDLLSSMMARLAHAEKELKSGKKEVLDKDKKIKILEEKVKLLERSRGYSSDAISELEKKCKALQRQVYEMEGFLEDYGMVWLGAEGADSDYEVLEENEAEKNEDGKSGACLTTANKGLWKPGSSVVNAQFTMDFDLVLKNIKELNILAGEGCAVVSHSKDGARLKVPDSVPLTLFTNGMVMFAGPFRPFSDPTTQQCMQDIMEGFFPSELQPHYPDGIPIQVTDKRDVVFQDKRTELLFPGTGMSLGGQGVNRDRETNTEHSRITSEIPSTGKKQSMDQFLSRIPKSVIKGGKIVDVRSGVADVIKGDSSKTDVLVLETPALEEIKSRADENVKNPDRPVSASTRVTTLRIKGETGDKTYILKMKFHETIADVRRHIDAVRSPNSSGYEIKTSFPNRVYDSPRATLQECGLVPNATLHLLLRRSGTS